MSIDLRLQLEIREQKLLSAHACLSAKSRGRQRPEPPSSVRLIFQQDRDKILHSKAFRRLKHKTQVFLQPEGDHYRTRLTHTLEVSQIARTLARALSLNEDLTEAISLGHDLGHTPFGHAGERLLARMVPGGFHHVNQSLRVVDLLEKEGRGLNLSYEVRDGILMHSKGRGALLSGASGQLAATLEGRLVRMADIIAYLNHDLDDALRAGIIREEQLPRDLRELLGTSNSRRINAMVLDIVRESLAVDGAEVLMSARMEQALMALRTWMFEQVYEHPGIQREFDKATRILEDLFGYFMADEGALLRHGGDRLPGDSLEVSVADFIAGMSDRFALNLFEELFLPRPWKTL